MVINIPNDSKYLSLVNTNILKLRIISENIRHKENILIKLVLFFFLMIDAVYT